MVLLALLGLWLCLCTGPVIAAPSAIPTMALATEAVTGFSNNTARATHSTWKVAISSPNPEDNLVDPPPRLLRLQEKLERRAVQYNKPEPLVTKKKKGKSRSTSSSSKETNNKKNDEESNKTEDSLALSTSMDTSSDSDKEKKNKKYEPESTKERHGWRKWHRKCTPCPEEMRMKWRDPRIKWICGAYQRARRSFKSACMMRYRNCQDGTMFIKLHDRRCNNDTGMESQPHGEHFMYDYKVKLSDESDKSSSSSSSSSSESSSSSTD